MKRFFSEYCNQIKSEKDIIMEFKTIKIQLGESMAWINLDRPEVRNAMDATMISELTEVFEWLNSRDDIRVIVIRGSGKAFSAGADLGYMKSMAGFNESENVADAERLSQLFRAVYFCNKAVIADVHGACIGGANGIVSAADIVIAEKETVFAFSEVKLGLTPATISPFVIARIGNTAARELMLTGRRFTAEEAKTFGLVNSVVDASEMVDKEQSYIAEFLQASPDAIAQCKALIRMNQGLDDPYDPIFERTSRLIAAQRVSAAGQEGLKAFFEKRKPQWGI